jgi:hypothetical protein
MKKFTSIVAFAVVSLFVASFVSAEEAKKAESKVAGCCAKAKADGKTCTHACCVEAAKDGKNCAKCGGAGDLAKEKKGKKKKAADQ